MILEVADAKDPQWKSPFWAKALIHLTTDYEEITRVLERSCRFKVREYNASGTMVIKVACWAVTFDKEDCWCKITNSERRRILEYVDSLRR